MALVQQSERRQDRVEELEKENSTLAARNRRLEEWTVEYRDRMHRAEVDCELCSLRCRMDKLANECLYRLWLERVRQTMREREGGRRAVWH